MQIAMNSSLFGSTNNRSSFASNWRGRCRCPGAAFDTRVGHLAQTGGDKHMLGCPNLYSTFELDVGQDVEIVV